MHKAEIIAIGDELTSGFRLDTNTQWLSQQLGELGVTVAFHTTVGDDLVDMTEVIRIAAQRAEIILVTGGLGPTADDLTRQAIADMAGVELEKNESVLNHIKQMYESRGREMPPNNEIQACFPAGSLIIENPEGTAPGVDFSSNGKPAYRIFALPGVPVEMKQMWNRTVLGSVKEIIGADFVIHHHTIHCFGSGESHIEALLPDLIARGRDPQVGITASAATISLRVSTRGDSISHCSEKMKSSIAMVHDCLGELVYGENGKQLEEVVVDLLAGKAESVAIVDAGLHGSVGRLISIAGKLPDQKMALAGSKATSLKIEDFAQLSRETAISNKATYGLVIGPIDRDETVVDAGLSFYKVTLSDVDGNEVSKEIRFSGHSGWREIRAVKEVLNFFRLHLLAKRA